MDKQMFERMIGNHSTREEIIGTISKTHCSSKSYRFSWRDHIHALRGYKSCLQTLTYHLLLHYRAAVAL